MPHTLPPFPESPANDPKARKTGSALFGLTLGMILLFLAATIHHSDDITRLVILAMGLVGVLYGLTRAQNTAIHDRMDILVTALRASYGSIKIIKEELNRVEQRTKTIESDLQDVETHLGIPRRTNLTSLGHHEEGGPTRRTRPLDPPPEATPPV